MFKTDALSSESSPNTLVEGFHRFYPSHAHPPRQTPRKLNSQQLTSVGNSHTQQYLVWSHKWWRQRIFITVRVLLSCRTISPFQMSGDKYFVEAVISLLKLYWASILRQQNFPLLTFTQEYTDTFLVHIKHGSIRYVYPTFHWSSQVWSTIAIGQPCSNNFATRRLFGQYQQEESTLRAREGYESGLDSL